MSPVEATVQLEDDVINEQVNESQAAIEHRGQQIFGGLVLDGLLKVIDRSLV